MKVQIKQLKCKRCGWTWTPRISDVKKCPNRKCQSVLWNVDPEPKKKKEEKEGGKSAKERAKK